MNSSISTHGKRTDGRARDGRRATTTKASPITDLVRALAAHAADSQNGMLALAVCFLTTYPDDARVVADSLVDAEERLRAELAEAVAEGWELEAAEVTRLIEQVISVRALVGAANEAA